MISGHVFIATSLDGYIAQLDGGIEWLLRRDDPNEDHRYMDFVQDMDGIIMGSGSFKKAVSFNPWPYTLPVVVLSQSLKDSDVPASLKGKVRIFNTSPSETMERLENEGWKKAYVDGGLIIQSFLRERLIADMVITTAPVLLGGGRRLFGHHENEISLQHVATTSFPSGLVQSKYRVLN